MDARVEHMASFGISAVKAKITNLHLPYIHAAFYSAQKLFHVFTVSYTQLNKAVLIHSHTVQYIVPK